MGYVSFREGSQESVADKSLFWFIPLDLSNLESLRAKLQNHLVSLNLTFDPRDQAGSDSHTYRQQLVNLIYSKKADITESQLWKTLTVISVAGAATASPKRYK